MTSACACPCDCDCSSAHSVTSPARTRSHSALSFLTSICGALLQNSTMSPGLMAITFTPVSPSALM